MIDDSEQSSRTQRNLELIVQTGLLLAKHLDLPALVQAATDAGLQLCGAQFGAFFYNVIDARGESYLLYTLSGVDREQFAQFPMPRNTAIFAPTFKGNGIVRSGDITKAYVTFVLRGGTDQAINSPSIRPSSTGVVRGHGRTPTPVA